PCRGRVYIISPLHIVFVPQRFFALTNGPERLLVPGGFPFAAHADGDEVARQWFDVSSRQLNICMGLGDKCCSREYRLPAHRYGGTNAVLNRMCGGCEHIAESIHRKRIGRGHLSNEWPRRLVNVLLFVPRFLLELYCALAGPPPFRFLAL